MAPYFEAKHVEKGLKIAVLIVDFLSFAIEEIGHNNGRNYKKAKYILEGRFLNIFILLVLPVALIQCLKSLAV